MTRTGPCKDCLTEGRGGLSRPTPHPGPRCVTHHRAVVKSRRKAGQEKRVLQVYGISAEEYDAIFEAQGGRCPICRRATGARKRLAVDHDHAQAALDGHELDRGCRRCVRGLLCSTCNKTHGHLRDDPEAWDRGAEYLRNWPSRRAGTAAEAESVPSGTAGTTKHASPAGA